MVRGASRTGFTLVEMMVTVAIFAVIAAAVASSFIGGIRLLKATFATAEMSLATRDLRDRLLFHAAPKGKDGTIWAGLLSGTNHEDVLQANATEIHMNCVAMKNNSGTMEEQSILLGFDDYGTEKCRFSNNGSDSDDDGGDSDDESRTLRWLHPDNLNLLADSASTPPLVWARKADGTEDHSRFYIYLKGRVDVVGLSVEHGERIVVPVFGRQQITRTDGKGGLDE